MIPILAPSCIFPKATDKHSHGYADETSEKRYHQHFSHLSLKIQIENITEIQDQNDHVHIAQGKRCQLVCKDQFQLMGRCHTTSGCQRCDVGLDPDRRAKTDKTSVQAGHGDQCVKELHISVNGTAPKGNFLYQILPELNRVFMVFISIWGFFFIMLVMVALVFPQLSRTVWRILSSIPVPATVREGSFPT